MTPDPLATPYSHPADPDRTGGRRVGVLLSHGFTSSPASMTPWAQSLAQRGYAVEVPRLPGHGTTWQELNTMRFADWYGEITRAFDRLREENDAVVVGGLSMGGTLTLRLAADRPEEVAGLVVVNPLVVTRRLDARLLPLVKHLVPSRPALAGDIKKPGVQEHAYSRTPLKALDSLLAAGRALVADLPRITAPLLYFRSAADHVVDDATEPVVKARVSSREIVERRLEDSYHVATLDNDAEQIFEESAEFIARVSVMSPRRT